MNNVVPISTVKPSPPTPEQVEAMKMQIQDKLGMKEWRDILPFMMALTQRFQLLEGQLASIAANMKGRTE
jgi:hypothetical protein